MVVTAQANITQRLEALFADLDQQAHRSSTPATVSFPQSPTRTLPAWRRFEQSMAAMPKKASSLPVQAISGNRLEGYAAVWNDASGKPYIDDYGDITVPKSWLDTIAYSEQERRATGRPHLIPHMRDHKLQIGGVLHLAEDSKGVIYQSQLSHTELAQDTYQLAKDGFIGTSYGYDPVQSDYVTLSASKRARRLLKVMAHEISSVTFPANPYALTVAKHGYTPGTLMDDIRAMQRRVKASNASWQAEKRLRYLDQVLDHKVRQLDNLFDRIDWHNR